MKSIQYGLLCCMLSCRSAAVPGPVTPTAEGVSSALQSDVEELHALAELTGLVRFWHPSDEAASTPWDLFVIHAASELLAESGRQDDRLAALFSPIAPTVHLAASRADFVPLVLPEGDGRVVAWGHQGVGLDRPHVEGHVSFRTNRPIWHMPDRQTALLYQNIKVSNAHSGVRRVTARWRLESEKPEAVRIHLIANDSDGEELEGVAVPVLLPGGSGGYEAEVSMQLPAEAAWLQLQMVARPVGGLVVQAVELQGMEPDQSASRVVPSVMATDSTGGWTLVGTSHEGGVDGAPVRLLSYGEWRETLPFEPETILGDVVFEALAPGLVARVPLALPTDAQSTLPRSEADLDAWRAVLGQVNQADRDRPEVRVASVIELWVVLRHLFPYRDSVTESWDSILDRALTEALETDGAGLESVLERMLLPIHDGHGSITDQVGEFQPRCPLLVEEAQGRFFITASDVEELQVGDELLTLQGMASKTRFAAEMALITGSPQWKQVVALKRFRTAPNGTWNATVQRGVETLDVSVACPTWTAPPTGPDFRELGDDLVYVDLRSRRWGTDENLARIDEARGVIVDLRGYPGLLRGVEHLYTASMETNGAWLRQLRWSRPDTFEEGPPIGFIPTGLRSDDTGPVIWMIDGSVISAGETALLGARAGRQTMIGSRPTAGADGENRWFVMMGAWRVDFTGNIARMMDGAPLYRVGFAPDIVVPLTPEGLAAGRDDVLAAAVVQLRKELDEVP